MKQPSDKTIIISVCGAVFVLLAVLGIEFTRTSQEVRSLAAEIERDLAEQSIAEY